MDDADLQTSVLKAKQSKELYDSENEIFLQNRQSLLKNFQSFGEYNLIENHLRRSSAITLEKSEFFTLEFKDYKKIFETRVQNQLFSFRVFDSLFPQYSKSLL
jgi:hypothetical protein